MVQSPPLSRSEGEEMEKHLAIGRILAQLDPSTVVALARLSGRTAQQLEVQLGFLRQADLGALFVLDMVSRIELRDDDQHLYSCYSVDPGFYELTRLASFAAARIADRHHDELVAYLREQYPTT